MTALIWKELRENLKWALLALLAMTAAQCYALFHTEYPGQIDTYFNDGITLCKGSFLMMTTFGYPAIGILLGLIQILPELKRDRWAALLHRPVRRGTIFLGKLLAGLILYGIAALVPFVISVFLVARPGNFATPFVPEMVYPGIADLCVGVAYYFAAVLLGLQQGSILRALPLLAAVHLSYFILDCQLFRVAVAAVALMTLALAVAGWGAIQNRESLKARRWLGRLAFLAVIFYGACGTGDLLKSITNVVAPAPNRKFVRYEFAREGVPLRVTYLNNVVESVTNPDGTPVTNPDYQPANVRRHIDYLNTLTNYIGDSHGWKPGWYRPFYRESSTYVRPFSPYSYPRLEQWFEIVKDNSLVCYLPHQKIAVAQFGREGFLPASAPVKSFPPEVHLDSLGGGDTCSVEGPNFVQFAYLAKREVVALEFLTPSKVFGASEVSASSDNGNRVQRFGVALTEGIAIYDAKASRVAMLPYGQDVDRWGSISLGITGVSDHFYLRYDPSQWIAYQTKTEMPSYLEERDLQGQTLQTYTLPPLSNPPYKQKLGTKLGQWLLSPAFFFGRMAYQKIGSALGSTRLRGELWWQFHSGLPLTREISIAITAISLILAAITLAWARHAQFPWKRAGAWAGCVLLLNLAGFIVFLLAADWPRLLPCPSCARSRRIDEDQCPACGAEWQGPEAADTEIFDQQPDRPESVPA